MIGMEVVACCFLYGWAEYVVHRFQMHVPGSHRFDAHTIRHHGRGLMGPGEADLTQEDSAVAFWYTLPITLPIAAVWDWSFLFVWGVTLFWAGFAWTAVHRTIHGERGYWYAYVLCPWLPIVRWNHLRHHADPRRGFGGMFWFLVDPFVGTV